MKKDTVVAFSKSTADPTTTTMKDSTHTHHTIMLYNDVPTTSTTTTTTTTPSPQRASSKPILIQNKMKKKSSPMNSSSLPNSTSSLKNHKIAKSDQMINSDHPTTNSESTNNPAHTNKNIKYGKSNTYSVANTQQFVDSRSRAKSFQNSLSTNKSIPLTNESKRGKPVDNMVFLNEHSLQNSPLIIEDEKQNLVTPSPISNTSPNSSPIDQKISSPTQKKLQRLKNNQYSTSAPSSCLHASASSACKDQESLDLVLDDLCTRFIINCPYMHDYGPSGFERLFFQLEEAFWFYR